VTTRFCETRETADGPTTRGDGLAIGIGLPTTMTHEAGSDTWLAAHLLPAVH
jgi:hypothetical protein